MGLQTRRQKEKKSTQAQDIYELRSEPANGSKKMVADSIKTQALKKSRIDAALYNSFIDFIAL